MALLLDFTGRFPGEVARVVAGAILAAVVINEGIGPWFLRGVIRDEDHGA
jgi:hypothetical protein